MRGRAPASGAGRRGGAPAATPRRAPGTSPLRRASDPSALRRAAVSALAALGLALAAAGSARAEPGYVVAAPDRGFLGNEEVRDVMAGFREAYPASELWIVTDEDAATHLDETVSRLRERAAVDRVVVLPLFLTPHHAAHRAARAAADSLQGTDLVWGDPLGGSYLAEEILFDRVDAESSGEDGERLVVVGAGSVSAADADSIRAALRPLAERATRRFGLAGPPVVEVLPHRTAPDSVYEAAMDGIGARVGEIAGAGDAPLVVPFGFARRLTTMMSDWSFLEHRLAAHGGAYADASLLPHENAVHWLRKEATRHRSLAPDEVGVVLVPHGAYFGWNEIMREGIAPLRDEFMTEDAFSMVDPHVLERAIRRLERRGARAAVVVRIFSLRSSFRDKAEYVLGLRREHDRFPTRIRSPLEFHTLGGVERSPHFAAALADRVRSISRDPSRETVILLGHGAGDEASNDHWMENLRHLAESLEERTDGAYAGYRYHTWREDWPEHRDEALSAIRAMVEEASAGDGVALVVPARTAAEGPAREYLEGLDFRYASGFAPHPEFTAWLRETVETGVAAAAAPEGAPGTAASGEGAGARRSPDTR